MYYSESPAIKKSKHTKKTSKGKSLTNDDTDVSPANLPPPTLTPTKMNLDDKETAVGDSQPPNVGLKEHQINMDIDDKQTSFDNSQPPNVGSEKPSSPVLKEDLNPEKKTSPNTQPSTHPLEMQTPQSSMSPFHNTYPDVTAGPVFSLGHDDAWFILDNACTKEKVEFHNSNWPIVTHFYNTGREDQDAVPCVHLLQCNHSFFQYCSCEQNCVQLLQISG